MAHYSSKMMESGSKECGYEKDLEENPYDIDESHPQNFDLTNFEEPVENGEGTCNL